MTNDKFQAGYHPQSVWLGETSHREATTCGAPEGRSRKAQGVSPMGVNLGINPIWIVKSCPAICTCRIGPELFGVGIGIGDGVESDSEPDPDSDPDSDPVTG
jgi:hypothetical protein